MIASSWDNYMMRVSRSSRKSYHKEKQSINVSEWILEEFYGLESRLVVPKDHQLRKQILDEAHLSKFSIHPGGTKILNKISGGLE